MKYSQNNVKLAKFMEMKRKKKKSEGWIMNAMKWKELKWKGTQQWALSFFSKKGLFVCIRGGMEEH